MSVKISVCRPWKVEYKGIVRVNWNGGFAPYGYSLEKGQLFINEEEAKAIRMIFDQYVHTDMGANGLAKYLENHGIHKIPRQNGKNPLFDAALIRRILKNPVYCGKNCLWQTQNGKGSWYKK